MSEQTTPSKADTEQATEFECHAPEAEKVFLAGSFNEWNPEVTPMDKTDNGKWTAKLKLEPGRYEFKFVVDGQWCCEANCHASAECAQCVPNDFGTMNRVCEVA
ncbi:MAG: glycoside hydrolase family 13 [Phycisphaera sp. RhM]|nr:glycoside hydrolase family 13 [Phycisphaera sp. RhM]